jgi:hypothetical protein
MAALIERYKVEREKNGKAAVPTIVLRVMEGWSSEFHWTDRCIARMQREADLAEMRVVEDLKAQKQARIAEARGLRSVGGQVVMRIIQRIQGGELNDIPLIGRMVYPEKGRPYRVDGLLDVLPKARQAIEIGQKLERTETGEDAGAKFEAMIEALIADMSPAEQAEVRSMAFRIAQGQE